MSSDDVYGNEMDESHGFDDETVESLIAGAGRDADSRLADLIADMRTSYVSIPPAVGAELAALLGTTEPVAASTPRRLERMRSSVIAKIGAATAAALAATGGLAVAGALPAPAQNAISRIGVGKPSHHNHVTTVIDDEETTTTTSESSSTTVPGDTTTTSVEPRNHGEEVSGVAHDDSTEGCEHGHAVAAVASGGKSQGKPCKTTPTTVGDGTTSTTVEDGNHGRGHGNEPGVDNDDVGDGESGEHGGPPTSVPGHGGGNQHGRSGEHGHPGADDAD